MTKISVIIPAYNVEQYLSRCLESVCGQTLKDIEIICINDCSTDNSLKILEQYFFELNEKIIWFYRDAKKFVRTDKSGQSQLYRESKADRDKLQVIHDGLLDTIKMFMSEKKYDDILKATEEQPKKQLQKKVKKKV